VLYSALNFSRDWQASKLSKLGKRSMPSKLGKLGMLGLEIIKYIYIHHNFKLSSLTLR